VPPKATYYYIVTAVDEAGNESDYDMNSPIFLPENWTAIPAMANANIVI